MIASIDVHAHVAIPAVDALLAGHNGLAHQRAVDLQTMGPESSAVNIAQMATLGPRLVDLGLRLAAMDAARVVIQAVSAVPLPHVWADRELADRIVAVTNEGVAAYCARASSRLLPIGTVSLQHPDLAVEQLRVAVSEYGVCGVPISTAAGPERELDHPDLAEFWSAAAELETAILIHPWGCSLGARLNAYYLFNSVGNPTETALALSRIAFSGILERNPELRVWSAHGGGYLAGYMVRADHAWSVRPDARKTKTRPRRRCAGRTSIHWSTHRTSFSTWWRPWAPNRSRSVPTTRSTWEWTIQWTG